MRDDESGEMSEQVGAPRACDRCDREMRLSYRETVESGGELRVYECHHCHTTATVVTSTED